MITIESEPAHGEGLTQFYTPPTQAAVEREVYINHRPTAPLSSNGPVQYYIPGNGIQYLNLYGTKHIMKLKIEREDGQKLDPEVDKVGFINMIHSTFWADCRIRLNQQDVDATLSGTYGYKSILETYMEKTDFEKRTKLMTELYFKDTPGTDARPDMMDSYDPKLGHNAGFRERWSFTKNGDIVELSGPLHADLFRQKRFLLPSVDLEVELTPARQEFIFMHGPDCGQASQPVKPAVPGKEDSVESVEKDNENQEGNEMLMAQEACTGPRVRYRAVLVDAYLRVAKAECNPAVLLAQQQVLGDQTNKTNAKYLYSNGRIKVYTIPDGNNSFIVDDVWQNKVPTFMVVGMVDSTSYLGSTVKNPFSFQSYNMISCHVYKNGNSVPGAGIHTDCDKGQILSAYDSFLSCMDIPWDVDRKQYQHGYFLMGFRLDPTSSLDMSYLPTIKEGNIQLSIKFKHDLKKAVNVIIYSAFPVKFEIDDSRNVIM